MFRRLSSILLSLFAVGMFFMPAAVFADAASDAAAQAQRLVEQQNQILLSTIDTTATGLFTGVTVACWRQGQCTLCDGLVVFINIANGILRFLAIVATIFFVYGAGLMMLSQGNEDWVSRGKAAMKATVVGVIITLIAWQLMSVIVFVLANQQNAAFSDTKTIANDGYNPLTSWYTVAERCTGRTQ